MAAAADRLALEMAAAADRLALEMAAAVDRLALEMAAAADRLASAGPSRSFADLPSPLFAGRRPEQSAESRAPIARSSLLALNRPPPSDRYTYRSACPAFWSLCRSCRSGSCKGTCRNSSARRSAPGHRLETIWCPDAPQ